jgi:hypothetical protein
MRKISLWWFWAKFIDLHLTLCIKITIFINSLKIITKNFPFHLEPQRTHHQRYESRWTPWLWSRVIKVAFMPFRALTLMSCYTLRCFSYHFSLTWTVLSFYDKKMFFVCHVHHFDTVCKNLLNSQRILYEIQLIFAKHIFLQRFTLFLALFTVVQIYRYNFILYILFIFSSLFKC